MKFDKFAVVIVITLFAILAYQNFFGLTGFVSMKIGDTSEIEGRTAEITDIGGDFVKLNIDNQKLIVKINDEKEINGIKVLVTKIFYVEEKENRFADISLEATAGLKAEQEKKNAEENKLKESNQKLDKCWQASDCDDKKPETIDLCTGTPKKCVNKIITQCIQDTDCSDGKEETRDFCKNNECFNEEIPGFVKPIQEMPAQTEKDTKETTKEQSTNIKKENFFIKLLKKIFGG